MRNTFGEALIALAGLAGFIALAQRGGITFNEVLAYAIALGVTVVFYFLLLLARAIFTFMAGTETFWWEKHKEEPKKLSRWGRKLR